MMKHIYFYIIFYLIAQQSLLGQRILFNSFNTDNGLSGSQVYSLLQDKTGFIWIGTDNGLNRFDGKEFKVFKKQPNDKNSISDNSIWALFEDKDGIIWIGTKEGILNKFDPVKEIFTRINLTSKVSSEIGITSILKDKNGSVWIGTYSQGLFKYDPTTGAIKNWTGYSNDNFDISNKYITSILQDKDGYIWISTYYGLNRIDPKNINKGFTKYYYNSNEENSIPNNLIWRVNQSKFDENRLILGTADGICFYDCKTEKIKRFNVTPQFPLQFSKSFATIVEQKIGNENILWAATYGGLYKINLSKGKTEHFIFDKKNQNGLLSNQIDQLLVDRSGVLWIATDKGLNYYTSKTQRFNSLLSNFNSDPLLFDLYNSDIKSVLAFDNNNFYLATSEGLYNLKISNYQTSTQKINTLNTINLWSLEKGLDNNIWIGTYGFGLVNLDLNSNQTKITKFESPTFKTLAFNYIKSLHQNKNGILWIGFWGGGLAFYDIKTEKYKIFRHDESNTSSISYNDVWALEEDKFGRLWIGTNGGGLNLLINSDEGKFRSFKYDEANPNSLLSNSVISVTEMPTDKKDETILLVGTENGINKVTIKNKNENIYDFEVSFEIFAKDELGSGNIIKGILRDDNSNVWISTHNGLTKYNTSSKIAFNFNHSNGFNTNIFNSNSCSKSKNGIMIFGSTRGPVIFNPDEINLTTYNPGIVFTDFLIFNRSITPGKESPLETSISSTKEIELSYQQNVFTFKFASLDYNSPEQINYMYKLDGFDDGWIKSGNRQTATYTNLNEGTYYFKVRATNSDGQWSKNEASIKLIINAPWWRSIWAYIAYLLVIGFGLYAIRKFELNRSRLRDELHLRDLESKKLREIEKIKSRFFTNLSHEFRTPLMLIKGPVEQLLNGNKVNQTEQINLIKRNSEKLQNLIDQLLELSQLEASSIELKAKKENLVSIVRGIFFSFSELADRKKITLSFNTVKDEISTWVDRDKFEKILNNLLSNAFKFTPENGKIGIEIVNTTIDYIDYTTISIKDSGIGIPADKVDKIFDRFFQVDDSSKRAYSGSGIGLSLVKELVDLHKWKIFVHSKEATGTEFILQIPLDENYLSDSQKIVDPETSFSGIKDEMIDSGSADETTESKSDQEIILKNEKSDFAKSTILIVEDSEDVRIYLQDILKQDYNLLIAENGEAGLIEALEKLPDLIISDVMMPIMDGIEFCRKVKSDWKTSHIPVILLTAKASSESKIEGLETGADDYVTKPFSFRELSIRIKNLLDQRKVLREKFGKNFNVPLTDNKLNKADQEFLEKANEIVDKNISNTEFDSDLFASQIFLSRSQLHRRIQSITGQSTGEFIRTIRLKKAAQLILDKKLSVTQIAFEVGFNSPSHFSKAFKQMFDCLPSEFIDRSKSF